MSLNLSVPGPPKTAASERIATAQNFIKGIETLANGSIVKVRDVQLADSERHIS